MRLASLTIWGTLAAGPLPVAAQINPDWQPPTGVGIDSPTPQPSSGIQASFDLVPGTLAPAPRAPSWQPDPVTAIDLYPNLPAELTNQQIPEAVQTATEAALKAVTVQFPAPAPALVLPLPAPSQPQPELQPEMIDSGDSAEQSMSAPIQPACQKLIPDAAPTAALNELWTPQPSPQSQSDSSPGGYVALSNGVYVPQSFMQADLAFRQAREARYQAWVTYQQAMNHQSAIVAALLPDHLWTPEAGSAYAAAPVLPTAQDAFPLYPLPIPAEMTSGYGWRIHPITGERSFHDGVDLAAPTGTPVLASLSGVVESTGWMDGYGQTVILRHLNGSLETLYGHLSAIYVAPGDVVRQGQTIGAVGSTGNSTGPHLHFELLQYGSSGWASIDNTDLVQFAQTLLQQQSGRYLQAVAASASASGVNPFAAPFFDPNLYLPSAPSTSRGIEIRVGVELDVSSFTVGGSAPLTITTSEGAQIGSLAPGQSYTVTRAGSGVTIGNQIYGGPVFVQPVGNGLAAINGRHYRGRVLLAARPQGGVSAINWVNLEQYLWGVVGHEVYPSWDSDALMAQSVAARSYALYYRYHPVSPDWYDIGDDTYYQAYGGTTKEFDTTTAAVNATAGQVLLEGNGTIHQAMYSATEEIRRDAHNGRGMVQWGAADKAASGWSYSSILSHYYPGMSLGQILGQ